MSPRRNTVCELPKDVREWLDKALFENNFSEYQALSKALEEKGFSISKSAIHRYGSKLEEMTAKLKAATETAKSFVEACPDDLGTMNEALTRLVQEKAFDILVKMEEPGEINFADLGHMISTLSRSSIKVKQYMAEVKSKTEQAAKVVIEKVSKGGLSAETIATIEREILGIAR
ncbi:MAG: DUF3486 family protein [Candidatus Riflebacteria bacterium]|nr:DUF3486 family protein [Candidatus Riflebacteria bacterium]